MKRVYLLSVVGLLSLSLLIACTKDKTSAVSPASTNVDTCSDSVRYNKNIKTFIDASCISCHFSGGTSPDFSTYSKISQHASAIYSSINSGSMPLGGSKLADSTIQNMQCWINQGKINN